MPVLLAHAIEYSTHIFGNLGGGVFETPNTSPPLGTPLYAAHENIKWCKCMRGNESYWHALEICSTAFPQEQSIRTCVSILRYTYMACPVHLIAKQCSCRVES